MSNEPYRYLGEDSPERGNSDFKGSEAEACLACLQTSKEDTAAECRESGESRTGNRVGEGVTMQGLAGLLWVRAYQS